MRRTIQTAFLVCLVLLLAVSALSCRGNEVRVRTGLRILCRYGHVITDTTRFVTVDAAQAKNYSVREETTICAAHLRAQKLYAQAQAALAKKQKSKAKALLAKVVGIDPAFKSAASQYKALGGEGAAGGSAGSSTKSSSSGSSSSSNSGGTTSGGTSSHQAGGTYLSRIPKSLTSYTLVSENEDALSGTRLFAARASSPVRLLTLSVFWLGKKTSFETWYRNTIRARYSVSLKTVTVSGSSAHFGTDGTKFAHICWAENGLVYQGEMEAREGNPKTLQAQLVSVANKL